MGHINPMQEEHVPLQQQAPEVAAEHDMPAAAPQHDDNEHAAVLVEPAAEPQDIIQQQQAAQIAVLQQQLENAQGLRLEGQQQIEALQLHLEQEYARAQERNHVIEDLQQRLVEMEQREHHLQEQLHQAREQHDESTEARRALGLENAALREQIQHLEEAIAEGRRAQQQQGAHLEQQQALVQERGLLLEATVQQHMTEVAQLQRQHGDAMTVIEEQLHQAIEQRDESTEARRALGLENAALRHQVQELEEAIAEGRRAQQHQGAHLEQQQALAQERGLLLEAALQQHRADIAQLQQDLVAAQDDIGQRQAFLEYLEQQHAVVIHNMQQELTQNRDALESSIQERFNTVIENTALKEEIERATERFTGVNERHIAEIHDLSMALAQADEERFTVRQELTAAQLENAELQDQVEEGRRILTELQQQLETQEEQLQHRAADLFEAEIELQHLRQHRAQTENDYAALVHRKNDEIFELREGLERASQRMTILSNRFTLFRNHNRELRIENDTLRARLTGIAPYRLIGRHHDSQPHGMRLDGGLPVELVDEQGSQIVPAVHQRGALIDRRYSHLARIMFVNGTLFLFSCYRNEINSGITAALSHLSDGIRSNYQQAQPLLCSAAAVVRHSVSQMMRSIQSWMIDSYRQLPQACQTALNSALTTGSVSIAFGGDGMRIEAPNQDYRLLMTPLLFCQRPFLQPQASQNNDDLVLIKQMLEREPYRELFKIKPARLT